jgi:two-component system, sensor histidine kinase and response regulator
MLWEDYSDILDQNGKRILNVIGKNAEKMGILIDDLLALSHLGKQEIQKTVVNMNELITNVLEDLNQSFPNKAEITIGNMPFVIGDSSLISHVVTNIMSNAIKYSSKREDPKIEITASHDLSNVIFCVRDNGVGFDMRYANKLFGVFQRLHLEKDFEGIGVGLAIANRIITRHGGRMWAESTLNQGAAFYFTLESVSK